LVGFLLPKQFIPFLIFALTPSSRRTTLLSYLEPINLNARFVIPSSIWKVIPNYFWTSFSKLPKISLLKKGFQNLLFKILGFFFFPSWGFKPKELVGKPPL